jgi:hypothetical protein
MFAQSKTAYEHSGDGEDDDKNAKNAHEASATIVSRTRLPAANPVSPILLLAGCG